MFGGFLIECLLASLQSITGIGYLKQRVIITSKSSKFKGETEHYVVKLPKSAGARHYCPKILQVLGTLGTRANSSPDIELRWKWTFEADLRTFENSTPC